SSELRTRRSSSGSSWTSAPSAWTRTVLVGKVIGSPGARLSSVVVQAGDVEDRTGAQSERVGDAVAGGDRAPLGGVAVVAGGDQGEVLPGLHLVGRRRLGRARRRVLRRPGLVRLELGERQVG